jgi:hypothetical protein
MSEENKQKPNKPQPKKPQPKKLQPWYIEPSASVSQFGDDVMEPKRTDTRKNITIGKGDKFKVNISKSDSEYQNIPIPKSSRKDIQGEYKTESGSTYFAGAGKDNTGGKSFNIGARWTFGGKKKGGLIKGHPKLAKKGWK